MRHTCWSRRLGLTLPELLTSIMVLMVVGGVVVSIYQTSFQTWRTGTVQNLSQQKATWTIQRMAPDLHQAMEVGGAAPITAWYICLQLPKREWDATLGAHLNLIQTGADGKPLLVKGQWVAYYLGDANGNPGATGSRLWRRLVADDGATTLRQEMVADNVVDNPSGAPLFKYYPDAIHAKSVDVTITIEESIGRRVGRATMNSQVALRNF